MVLKNINQDDKVSFDLLRKSSIFYGLGDSELWQLVNLAQRKHFSKGETIYDGDVNQHYINIVAKGKVQILLTSPSGKQFVAGIRGAGETFFDIPNNNEDIVFNIAQAIDETEILLIPWEDFFPFMIKNNIVARNIMQLLSVRVKNAYRMIIDLVADSTFHRILKTLISLSSVYGSELPFSGRQIANMSGTTPETTSRIINSLKNKGIVKECRKRLVCIDIDKCRELIMRLDVCDS